MDAVDWSAFSAAEVLTFADTVARVARDLARSVPAPRGTPLFGLDMTVADPELLDRFSRHGIFRKYQRAVALGSGLGGVQRWWSVHFGCRVLSVDPHAGVIEAAERLGAPTGLAERSTFRVAPLDNLPLRAEQFTHAWSVEDLTAQSNPAAILREALRVLRPAGLLTIALRGAAPDAPEVARLEADRGRGQAAPVTRAAVCGLSRRVRPARGAVGRLRRRAARATARARHAAHRGSLRSRRPRPAVRRAPLVAARALSLARCACYRARIRLVEDFRWLSSLSSPRSR